MDLRHWVNDGLMTIFFFVVGLEIKRELVEGELRDRRKAIMPVVGAVGGMVVPALIFLAWTAGTPQARGWGIPMATDIALAVGLLTLAGPRIPAGAKLFRRIAWACAGPIATRFASPNREEQRSVAVVQNTLPATRFPIRLAGWIGTHWRGSKRSGDGARQINTRCRKRAFDRPRFGSHAPRPKIPSVRREIRE